VEERAIRHSGGGAIASLGGGGGRWRSIIEWQWQAAGGQRQAGPKGRALPEEKAEVG
jgi:hypothetical protein